MITSIIAIIAALMHGHTVACITNRTGFRFTYCRWSDTGEICRIDETGHILWYCNIWALCKHLRQAESNGIRFDAAIIDDLREEQEFLAGREAAAKLLDPPAFLKAA
jgi:hypothetical protein